jgi:hypothetical protein
MARSLLIGTIREGASCTPAFLLTHLLAGVQRAKQDLSLTGKGGPRKNVMDLCVFAIESISEFI